MTNWVLFALKRAPFLFKRVVLSKELKAEVGSNLSRFFCPDFYRDQIVCDVEYLIENGKWEKVRRSKRQARDCEPHENTLTDHETASQGEEKPSAQDMHFVSDPSGSSVVELAELPEQDPLCEQEWDCVEDCLLSNLSDTSCFDADMLLARLKVS